MKGTHDARCIRYVTRHKNEEYFEDDGTVVDRNPHPIVTTTVMNPFLEINTSLDNKSGEFFLLAFAYILHEKLV